jgi:acyl carrier protein
MVEVAALLASLVLILLATGGWRGLREQHIQPVSAKEAFVKLICDNFGLDPKRVKDSTFLLSGPWADELDITELFQELEDEFDIDLPDSDTAGVETVGALWELVGRKIATPPPPD